MFKQVKILKMQLLVSIVANMDGTTSEDMDAQREKKLDEDKRLIDETNQKMEENATYHIKSAYYKEGKNYWLGYRASKMDVAGVISYFYRDSNKTPYADAYDYKNSYKSLNYTTSSDRLVALAKKYYKSGAVDEDITYGSTFYLN